MSRANRSAKDRLPNAILLSHFVLLPIYFRPYISIELCPRWKR